MSNKVYERMVAHNSEQAEIITEYEAFERITNYSCGLRQFDKRNMRALIKQERLKHDAHVLEYEVDMDAIRLLRIKFFDATEKWKPGSRRGVLNAFKDAFVTDAPVRFRVRLFYETSLERVPLDLRHFANEIDYQYSMRPQGRLIVAFVFDSDGDAMLYRLWKA